MAKSRFHSNTNGLGKSGYVARGVPSWIKYSRDSSRDRIATVIHKNVVIFDRVYDIYHVLMPVRINGVTRKVRVSFVGGDPEYRVREFLISEGYLPYE